jgi:hypothetical protein
MKDVLMPPWEAESLPTKVVGRRRPVSGFAGAEPLLRLALELRGDRPFVPKGVHRFATFEESDAWLIRMMAWSSRPARRS